MNKELKERYRKGQEIVWKNNQKMIDFCCKDTDIVFPVRDYIAGIQKPRIETSFCFSYGYCGVSDEEDYRDAARMAEHARTSENYFIKENMKDLDEMIQALRGDRYIAYAAGRHYVESGIVSINFCNWYEKETAERNHAIFIELTPAEREEIAGYYEIEKERFTKRLRAYLKRYGLSKVHSWSFLSD